MTARSFASHAGTLGCGRYDDGRPLPEDALPRLLDEYRREAGRSLLHARKFASWLWYRHGYTCDGKGLAYALRREAERRGWRVMVRAGKTHRRTEVEVPP